MIISFISNISLVKSSCIRAFVASLFWDIVRPKASLGFSAASGLNEEQMLYQKMATDFARNEMLPNMEKWDREVGQNVGVGDLQSGPS